VEWVLVQVQVLELVVFYQVVVVGAELWVATVEVLKFEVFVESSRLLLKPGAVYN
jgi:hypothetical protein